MSKDHWKEADKAVALMNGAERQSMREGDSGTFHTRITGFEVHLLEMYRACNADGQLRIIAKVQDLHQDYQAPLQTAPKPQAAHVISLATFKQAGKGR